MSLYFYIDRWREWGISTADIPTVSHTGEWSQGVIKTIEWLCEQRRKSKRELFGDKRQAGSAKDQAVFRARFKDNIACTTARGVGRILAVGGHFFPSKDEEEWSLK